MAPELLFRISNLPFEWRLQYEDLTNHYGHERSVEQQEILEDLKDSYERLNEALDSLLSDLRNRQLESRTRKEDFTIYAQNLDQEQARDALTQSIQFLSVFHERWSKLEDVAKVPTTPQSFQSLFKPLEADRLKEMLGRLREGRSADGKSQGDGAGKTKKAEAAETRPTPDETGHEVAKDVHGSADSGK
jgi:hypothetical protein